MLDKPIVVVSADHQNKPDIASSIANQWIDAEQVDAIMDLTTSSVGLAIQEIGKNKNRVTINSGAATSDLTGPKCSPTGIHYAYDTYALANGTGTAVVKEGGDSWFFITADYAFGHALERDTAAAVTAAGGKVLGDVKTPFPGTTDFSSFLLQAQGSGAKVIGPPMPAATPSTPSSRPASSALSPAARSWPVSWSSSPTFTASG